MSTITLDPALAKLLATLPPGDPDAQPGEPEKAPPDLLEVWIPLCEGKPNIVKADTRVTLRLGIWQGPVMASAEITVLVRNLRTGVERAETMGPWSQPTVGPGTVVQITNWIFHP